MRKPFVTLVLFGVLIALMVVIDVCPRDNDPTQLSSPELKTVYDLPQEAKDVLIFASHHLLVRTPQAKRHNGNADAVVLSIVLRNGRKDFIPP